MTRQEQIKFCSICKNKKNDFEKGVICNLTQDKATFENSCENFEPDLEEIKKRTGKDVDLSGIAKNDIPSYVSSIREEQIGNKLGGWTIFFIVTIFISLGLSIYTTIQSIHEFNGLEFISGITNLKIFEVLYLLAFCVLGIYTAFCLITKKSNAVAVMRTFLIVGLIDTIANLIFAKTNSELMDNKDLKQIVRGFTYFVTWLIYSFQSQNLQTVFPKSKRTWLLPEKIMGIITIALCVLTLISIEKAIKSAQKIATGDFTEISNSNNSSVRNFIELNIANSKYPYKFNDEMTCTEESLVGDVYTIKAKFNDINYSDFDGMDINEMEQKNKEAILNSLSENQSSGNPIIMCAKENITIKNECYSSDDKLIYSITITPEDIYSRIK